MSALSALGVKCLWIFAMVGCGKGQYQFPSIFMNYMMDQAHIVMVNVEAFERK